MNTEFVPFTAFGKTKLVPLNVYLNSRKLDIVLHWDCHLWIERDEDWYALLSEGLKYKRVLVVKREDWLNAEEINQ